MDNRMEANHDSGERPAVRRNQVMVYALLLALLFAIFVTIVGGTGALLWKALR